MDVLFLSTACSKKMLDQIFLKKPAAYGIQGQKFLNLLISGLKENADVDLFVFSKYTNRTLLYNKLYYKGEIDEMEGISYYYLPELKFCSTFFSILFSFYAIVKWKIRHRNGKILCDGLNFSLLLSAYLSSIVTSARVTCFVTDLPRFLFTHPNGIKKWKTLLFVKAWERLIALLDSFVFLTEGMNQCLNVYNKPYIVMEGLIDSNAQKDHVSAKCRKKICLYTGSIMRIYGIDKLVYAFKNINNADYELHIYGGGDFEDELQQIISDCSNIHFKGWVSNDDIIHIQRESTLLINPRPSEDEYTKYSFPSKTLEYMLSGTPVLSTRLPCIPEEYFKYLYFFEDESIQGMTRVIDNVLSLDLAIILERAEKAKRFVLSSKSECIQVSRIVSLMSFN